MKPNQTIMFFGIKPNKPKISNIKTEPNETRYGFKMVANFYKSKYQKAKNPNRNRTQIHIELAYLKL